MNATRALQRRSAAAVLVAALPGASGAGVTEAGARAPGRATAPLRAPERAVLERYVSALAAERYGKAFALLAPSERRYFGSSVHFRSAYEADRLRILSFAYAGGVRGTGSGAVGFVVERIRFYDRAARTTRAATATVAYGLSTTRGATSVNDPHHPWLAFAPDASATADEVRASIDKISFFSGRVEIVASFENTGARTVTLLPYGRSSVRDETGTLHYPLAVRAAGLTDAALFTGLRLRGGARYTGYMTFSTAGRFVPKTLAVVFAPLLKDGADTPFEIRVPAFRVPS